MNNIPDSSLVEETTYEQERLEERLEKASLEYATRTAREFGYPEDAIGKMIKTTRASDFQVGDVVFLGTHNSELMRARSISLYSAPEGDGYAGVSPRNDKNDKVLHVGQKLKNITLPNNSEPVYIIRNGIDIPTF